MKSLLREMEEKFTEISNRCDQCDESMDEGCNCDEIKEQNVASAVAGYSTPNAFRKKVKKVGYATGIEESVNTPPTYKIGEHQRPESEEEEFNDKFPFATDDKDWYHGKFKYPSIDMTGKPGKAPSNTVRNLKSEDILENQYLKLIEGYRQFATNDPKLSPEKKVNNTIKEIAKKLQEIETLVQYNSKLKTESGISSSEYGKQTQKALTKISERLIKISERVRSLGE